MNGNILHTRERVGEVACMNPAPVVSSPHIISQYIFSNSVLHPEKFAKRQSSLIKHSHSVYTNYLPSNYREATSCRKRGHKSTLMRVHFSLQSPSEIQRSSIFTRDMSRPSSVDYRDVLLKLPRFKSLSKVFFCYV